MSQVPQFLWKNLAQFEHEYSALGAAFGRPGATPLASELEFVRGLTSRSWSGIAQIDLPEILFAAAATSILRPPILLEIGTAAGFSAALFAQLIFLRQSAEGKTSSRILVHTIDKKVASASKPGESIGFAIDLVAPAVHDRIAVHRGHDSAFCSQLKLEGRLGCAFIDANHRHPWPLLDLLRVLPLMGTGWIFLHDIDLPNAIARARAQGGQIELEPDAGAKYVFDFWPGRKIGAGNIGAIEVTAAARQGLGDFVERLRRMPSEVKPASQVKRWGEIEEALRAALSDLGRISVSLGTDNGRWRSEAGNR